MSKGSRVSLGGIAWAFGLWCAPAGACFYGWLVLGIVGLVCTTLDAEPFF